MQNRVPSALNHLMIQIMDNQTAGSFCVFVLLLLHMIWKVFVVFCKARGENLLKRSQLFQKSRVIVGIVQFQMLYHSYLCTSSHLDENEVFFPFLFDYVENKMN